MTSTVVSPVRSPSGHVFRAERKRGAVWYAKYRLPDGRQVQRKLGPAWPQRGRPPAGYFTKRLAEDWLRDVFDQARRGTLAGMVSTGATFADAAAEFLRYAEHDRGLKPSTLRGYRSIIDAYLLPAFGERRLEDITAAEVERWRSQLVSVADARRRDAESRAEEARDRPERAPRALSNNSKNRIVVLLHGVFARACKAYGCRSIRCRGSSAIPSSSRATSMSSARRRCGRWCARPRRTGRST
jgi:hypothetical protein